MPINITGHSEKKARKRLKWNPEVLQKEATAAWEHGLRTKDAKGQLRNYLLNILLFNKKTEREGRAIVYNEVIFIFAKKHLLTVYPLPSALRKFYNVQK